MTDGAELEDLWIQSGPVRLHAVAAGPVNGPLVILLHGFPEFWYSWHRQMRPLADAGFRVVAPDQRGYKLSSKPPLVRDYSIDRLVSDVIAVADHLSADSFFLAGHDWGAAVAWMAALRHPQRVRKLAILNVPHPAVMLRTIRRDPRQMLRSWYIGFFQTPWLPEKLFSMNGFAWGTAALVKSSLPRTFTEEDLGRYRTAWSRPDAVRSMINWYRAFARYRPKIGDKQVQPPTRILWGKRDRFLLPDMAEESVQFCRSAEITYFPGNTHWIQHEQPDAVSQALCEFFGKRESAHS